MSLTLNTRCVSSCWVQAVGVQSVFGSQNSKSGHIISEAGQAAGFPFGLFYHWKGPNSLFSSIKERIKGHGEDMSRFGWRNYDMTWKA